MAAMCAGANGFEDCGVDLAALRGGLNSACIACWLGFEAGGVARVLRG